MLRKICRYVFLCLFACVAFFLSAVLGCVLREVMPLWLITLICVLLIALCFVKLAEIANDSEKEE